MLTHQITVWIKENTVISRWYNSLFKGILLQIEISFWTIVKSFYSAENRTEIKTFFFSFNVKLQTGSGFSYIRKLHGTRRKARSIEPDNLKTAMF